MHALHLTHLILLGAWGGVVLAETVIEFVGSTEEDLRQAARLHYWIDLCVELPLLAGILATGVWLTVAVWPLTVLHWVKIVAALLAIGTNLWCAVLVVQRHRAAGDVAALRVASQRIRKAWLGVPFGLAALVIGFWAFGHG